MSSLSTAPGGAGEGVFPPVRPTLALEGEAPAVVPCGGNITPASQQRPSVYSQQSDNVRVPGGVRLAVAEVSLHVL